MSDTYQAIANSPMGKALFSAINLPIPVILERWQPGQNSFVSGRVLVGAAPGSSAVDTVFASLKKAPEARPAVLANNGNASELQKQAAAAGVSADNYTATKEDETRFKALVFDATGIESPDQLKALWEFFHPVIKKLDKCARVVVIGRTPETLAGAARVAQRGLEGFTRSVGKEIKRGATVQLVYCEAGAESQLAAPLHFFLSPKSAYVSAQVVRVGAAGFDAANFDWDKPLAGKKALVTGGSRGIGASIARVLARDGAQVTVLDIPPMAEDLNKVAEEIQGQTLELDITSEDAPRVIAEAARKMGGLDIVVHNAGVTRDKMLGNMPENFWDMVMNINIASQLRINEQLVADDGLGEGGRIISISSIAGIAGNLGQTNYGTSKAAVIGMIDTYSEEYADKGITVNAVAPGFIETQMTAAIPFTIREAGRRMNAMNQGGQPVDVAEAIAFFASPAAQGLTGNVIRVCGQMMLGA
ncbi:3-oxoacyl-ACP reductase [Alloalcanivorax gelatiniphagus]|uniref:3-oxoacyl-ACP reductase n=1 Tax=Alloalcanivorax gelatiniphagus TaxID=1194167 RepID=A0ABY2XKL9_9GAMM|nr:3-oxoacyl-ACP reductase [Alloalcanivorax gelatiniphagus]TMW12668.1 3-oxoacyl-ACP reductase [Alloalcanivorax gelatiniphagus]|tara:strand:+ start:4983 stop:6401 length:1419 start_codon:yes stop_codon:yes gene_type:complete